MGRRYDAFSATPVNVRGPDVSQMLVSNEGPAGSSQHLDHVSPRTFTGVAEKASYQSPIQPPG